MEKNDDSGWIRIEKENKNECDDGDVWEVLERFIRRLFHQMSLSNIHKQ